MTDATRPANSAVQSKNIWNESDIRPRLKESMWYWSYLLVMFSELNRTTWVILRNRVTCWSIFHTPIPQTQKTNWGEGKRINSLNFHWKISLCEKTDEKMLWHHWTHGQKRSWIPFKIEVILELYLSHSSIRDLSFSPGLKSSLLKLSLLVNGSMPTLFLGRPQTHSQPAFPYYILRGIQSRTHFLCTRNASWDSCVTVVVLSRRSFKEEEELILWLIRGRLRKLLS